MRTNRLHLLILLSCVCLLAHFPVAAQSKFIYGVTAMTLGQPIKSPLTVNTPISRWIASPKLDRFYKSGGERGNVTPTQARLAWTNDTLYVLFQCTEPNMDHPGHVRQFKLADHVDNSFLLDTYFQDRVDIYIRPTMVSGHFYQFSVAKDGQSAGVIRGKLTEVKNPEGGGEVTKDPNARFVTRFKMDIKAEKDAWTVFIKIPWSSLEGKPSKPFGLLLSRTRWRDSERTSPAAVDFDDRPPPDLFIETTFGVKSAVIISQQMLSRLPSGTLRWQRPALLKYPSPAEKAAIWTLQQTLGHATTPETLNHRVHLTQRWCDLLTLEGFNFRKEGGGPVPFSIQPYDIRRKVNQALLSGNVQGACDSLDGYLKTLNLVSRNWFADGSPGNIQTKSWQSFSLNAVKPNADRITLDGIVGGRPYQLTMQFPAGGGIRLFGEKAGYFNPANTETIQSQIKKGEPVLTASEMNVSVKTGADWQVNVLSDRHSFRFDKHSFLFWLNESGQVKAVQLRQPLDPKTIVRGSGERFNAANLNGHTMTLYGMDDYPGITIGLRNQTYKPIPFFQTPEYSLFFNSSYRLRADLGQSELGVVTLTVHGPVLDVYLWPETPDRALQHYTDLTGKPVVPPGGPFNPGWAGQARTGMKPVRASPLKQCLLLCAKWTVLVSLIQPCMPKAQLVTTLTCTKAYRVRK